MAANNKAISRSDSAGHNARQRLIDTGLVMFGQLGYDGVSVRQLCDQAQMNVASINYHFGNKEGLYVAVADHIIEQLKEHNCSVYESAAEFLASGDADPELAMEHLLVLVESFVDLLIPNSKRSQCWAKFISRFQIEDGTPNHDLSDMPFHSLARDLVGVTLGQRKNKSENSILAQTIFGQILVFRVNRLSARKALGIKSFGSREVSEIKNVVFSNIRKMLS